MPRRLLQDPHILAHELRTPLAILAGWMSLVRDGDVSPERDLKQWNQGMAACEEAVARLNTIISQACDEATALKSRRNFPSEALIQQTTKAIEESQRVLTLVRTRRVEQHVDIQ